MSNFDKLVRARVDKTGESWSTAARHVRAQVIRPVNEPPYSGPVYMLTQVYQGAHTLLDRSGRRPTPFTTSVNSYKRVDDRVSPNGEVNMVPLMDMTFIEESPAKWRIDCALAFIEGELYDGNKPVTLALLDDAGGRERIAKIIMETMDPWFVERLEHLRVKSGFMRRDNLILMVSLGITDPIDKLLVELRAFHVSSIRVGRMPAVGRSATASIAAEHARDLANNPKYFADSAFVKKVIKHEQLLALVRRGATEEGGVQRIRIFRGEQGQTFSVPCVECDRWIWCGTDEHSGMCKCGQEYVVSFDGEIDWSLPLGVFCMDCGDSWDMGVLGDRPRLWHAINAHQKACDVCFHMSHIGAWWVQKRAGERQAAKVAAEVLTEPDPASTGDAIDPYADNGIDPYANNGIDPYANNGIDPYAALDPIRPQRS